MARGLCYAQRPPVSPCRAGGVPQFLSIGADRQPSRGEAMIDGLGWWVHVGRNSMGLWCIYINIYIYIHMHMCIYIYTYMYAYVYVCVCICIYIYIRSIMYCTIILPIIYAYTHVCRISCEIDDLCRTYGKLHELGEMCCYWIQNNYGGSLW